MNKKETERETFGAPSKLAGETYQSMFEQVMNAVRGLLWDMAFCYV